MSSRRLPILVSCLFVALAACGDPPATDGPDADAPDLRALDYAEHLQVDFDEIEVTGTGLHYRDLDVGTGPEAASGSTVVVHYTGSFPDGTVFDSSRERGDPFTLQLDRGMVIPGWDEGLQGMREGGHRILVLPPQLGYGAAGAGGVIPPNAVLVFDVEMLEVR